MFIRQVLLSAVSASIYGMNGVYYLHLSSRTETYSARYLYAFICLHYIVLTLICVCFGIHSRSKWHLTHGCCTRVRFILFVSVIQILCTLQFFSPGMCVACIVVRLIDMKYY
mmetsp:Transcript_47786/g.76589  ORF Transcript_47786/g.76589 Transcript_47786/m.76589 type:complete len:112 (-) Transcript_47786:101-436(-)